MKLTVLQVMKILVDLEQQAGIDLKHAGIAFLILADEISKLKPNEGLRIQRVVDQINAVSTSPDWSEIDQWLRKQPDYPGGIDQYIAHQIAIGKFEPGKEVKTKNGVRTFRGYKLTTDGSVPRK